MDINIENITIEYDMPSAESPQDSESQNLNSLALPPSVVGSLSANVAG